jgi:hypothetical protein
MTTAITPQRVRYIKLGTGGCWEKECRKKGIVRFGFGSCSAERFPLCQSGRWDELTRSFMAEGKTNGVATRFTNETRLSFEDDGTTLWITFMGETLYWGFLEPGTPERHDDGDGVWRRVRCGWRSTDLLGEKLTKDRLSGALTQIAAYRGTSRFWSISYSPRVDGDDRVPSARRRRRLTWIWCCQRLANGRSSSRMFCVHHSGAASTDDDRVFVIGPDRLPELVLDAGLASWLIRKVS